MFNTCVLRWKIRFNHLLKSFVFLTIDLFRFLSYCRNLNFFLNLSFNLIICCLAHLNIYFSLFYSIIYIFLTPTYFSSSTIHACCRGTAKSLSGKKQNAIRAPDSTGSKAIFETFRGWYLFDFFLVRSSHIIYTLLNTIERFFRSIGSPFSWKNQLL